MHTINQENKQLVKTIISKPSFSFLAPRSTAYANFGLRSSIALFCLTAENVFFLMNTHLVARSGIEPVIEIVLLCFAFYRISLLKNMFCSEVRVCKASCNFNDV